MATALRQEQRLIVSAFVMGSCVEGGRSLLLANEGVYHDLMLYKTGMEKIELEIVRDLNRTYPSHVYFQQKQGPGQRSLFNVLKAYSVYDKKVHPSPLPVCLFALHKEMLCTNRWGMYKEWGL